MSGGPSLTDRPQYLIPARRTTPSAFRFQRSVQADGLQFVLPGVSDRRVLGIGQHDRRAVGAKQREQLHARAEMLEETGELAGAVTAILTGASGAGVDPHAITGLRAAIAALHPAGSPPDHQAGSSGRYSGAGYGSDSEFLEAVSDAEDQIRGWLRDASQFQEQVTAAAGQAHDERENAQRDLDAARRTLAAAYAMPTGDPCTDCHPAKAAAITDASAAADDASERISHAARRISICQDTAEILDPLIGRLQVGLQALSQVPHDLGEVYELIYKFIRSGGKMPRFGRWIQGGTPA